MANYLDDTGHRVVLLEPAAPRAGARLAEGRAIARRHRRPDGSCDLDGITVFLADLYTPPNDPVLAAAHTKHIAITSLADLLLRRAPGPTVGVTGSAGKTTTTSLLSKILSGINTKVRSSTDERFTPSGPAPSMLRALSTADGETWHVLELTSHHLEHVSTSPDIAVVTNLFPDHQAWHGSYDAYRDAKKRILQFQRPTDVAILNYDDREVREHFGAAAVGRTVLFSRTGDLEKGVVVVEGTVTVRTGEAEHAVCQLDDLHLPAHHLPNALAAAAAAHSIGVAAHDIGTALKQFWGLPQRTHRLGRVRGVEIYDDTTAMSPIKALSGLASFADHSVVVVCGGAVESRAGEPRVSSDAEQRDLRRFCTLLTQKASGAVLFGPGGLLIGELLRNLGLAPTRLTPAHEPDFPAAVQRALTMAEPDGQILVAPVYYNDLSELTPVLTSLVEQPSDHEQLRAPGTT
ncbi:Mur ligase family protein [Nocardia sp. NPDC059239]|uniref:Mur ligase family protein n=1 Tax=Nocardia sp. NPDC059239 TaxID=3346785 RepID=UPI0036AB4728